MVFKNKTSRAQIRFNKLIKNVFDARLWNNIVTTKFNKRSKRDLFIHIFKSALIAGNSIYFVLLAMSISVANYSYGYNMITNVVSDLGGSYATSMPFIFDTVCIMGGLLMIPLFYMISAWLSTKDGRISWVVFRSGIIGTIGFIFVGIFSMDRGGPHQILHGIAALFAFGGFMLSAFFLGIYLIKQKNSKIRYFGYFGIFFPFIMVILWGVCLISLFEWLLFLSLQGFTFPFNLKVLIR